MCSLRALDQKTRTIYSIGNAFLVIGISMTILLSGWRVHHRVLFDSVRGVCLSLAIILLFWVVLRKRRNCATPKTGSD
jgi:hypothetical protein